MAGSGFDGTIDLNESLRFIDFHPIATDADAARQYEIGAQCKHVVIPIKSIYSLWTDENGCFIGFNPQGHDSGGFLNCSISPSEYKTICQRLGISGDNP